MGLQAGDRKNSRGTVPAAHPASTETSLHGDSGREWLHLPRDTEHGPFPQRLPQQRAGWGAFWGGGTLSRLHLGPCSHTCPAPGQPQEGLGAPEGGTGGRGGEEGLLSGPDTCVLPVAPHARRTCPASIEICPRDREKRKTITFLVFMRTHLDHEKYAFIFLP